MNSNTKKIITFFTILLLTIIVLLPIFYSFKNSIPVVIKDRNNKFFRAKTFLSYGDILFCQMGDKIYSTRSGAYKNRKIDYSLKILKYENIKLIEVLRNEIDSDNPIDLDKRYLGVYNVKVTGHEGILKLYIKDNQLRGTVRFPGWAKGATEYLKNVRIKGNKVSFTRSVSTAAELRRIGAGRYFVQKFDGTYKNKGNKIIGRFFNRGAQESWEAEK